MTEPPAPAADLPPPSAGRGLPAPAGAHVDLDGERWYRIVHLESMAPFLVALASDSDHWLFASSTGALTAGRRDPDNALFPYYTDDKIHDGWDQTGGKTLLGVYRPGGSGGARPGRRAVWEPLSPRQTGRFRITRSLAKHVLGNAVRFEEDNHDLGLCFRHGWAFSERFGFVRRASLENRGTEPLEIEILDGVQNLLPAGVTRRFQLEYSTLADGYKKSELDPATGLGLYLLSSIPTDKAEPSEPLLATTVWGLGLAGARRLLSTAQLDRFRAGERIDEEHDVRGRRGAYLQHACVTLAPGARHDWLLCADVRQDATAVAATLERLRDPAALAAEVAADLDRGTRNLRRIVASADGLQLTGDELDTWRHYSNALNNVLRGGVPDSNHAVPRADLGAFLATHSRAVAGRHAGFVAALPETIDRGDLVERATALGDPDLERLVREYLPITFGRRHGDPSRPWNSFSIAVRDERGQRVLDYQGNWRDVFQNWEALGMSFPRLLEGMIVKFLDCSTADGHNPYHVMRGGFDWEVTDPHDEWSFIGYWGDHQVIYLLKLLERLHAVDPEALPRLLGRRIFAYADVPYRIKPYPALLADPRRTIDFDAEHDRVVRERAAAMGADGKLLQGASGQPCRASLAEKLLLVALARLANYVEGAGIWMNTQRPEWNDANNALVGNGVSVVTLCQLRGYLAFCRPLFAAAPAEGLPIAVEVHDLFSRIAASLASHQALAGAGAGNSEGVRRRLLDALGTAASDYRAGVYARGLSGEQAPVTPAALVRFCDVALAHLDPAIRANRRDDGLYHAYNLMALVDGGSDEGGVRLRRLQEMLEGQVAVLGAGVLEPAECVAVLDSLRASRLFREDQRSYLLYPDRALPRFLEKNNLPAEAAQASPLLARLLERDDRRVVLRDGRGGVHFHPSFRNAELLRQALLALDEGALGELASRPDELSAEVARVVALYDDLFDHQSFTGRSGTFYKYEGLGCIYWHMVSKLLLAVQEAMERADRLVTDPSTGEADRPRHAAALEALGRHYDAIREGIGVHKSPALFGAIPTDPHSHTPSFAGAQQPGMTGQVKEDLLARLGELGLQIEGGRVVFRPALMRSPRFLAAPRTFHYLDVAGEEQRIELPAGTLAFTACQVPVVLHAAGPLGIEVAFADGTGATVEGLTLDRATSAALFARRGRVRRLDVRVGAAFADR